MKAAQKSSISILDARKTDIEIYGSEVNFYNRRHTSFSNFQHKSQQPINYELSKSRQNEFTIKYKI